MESFSEFKSLDLEVDSKRSRKLVKFTLEEQVIQAEEIFQNTAYREDPAHKHYFEYKDESIKGKNLSQLEIKALDLLINRYLNARIVNAVAPITTGEKIDHLRIIAACKKNDLPFIVHPKFSGLPVKFNTPKIKFTAVFFKSGKVNIIGLGNDKPDHLNLVIEELSKYQLDFFETPVFDNCTKRLANRVYAVSIPKIINLKELHLFNQVKEWKNIKYNSQSFPGVTIKFQNFKSKALFFKTGSVIFTGIISDNCKYSVLTQFIDTLIEYLELKKDFDAKKLAADRAK